jgi:hypothetical protein
MPTAVDRAGFQALFDNWNRSAWRFECQGVYREPKEQEPLRRFLAGEPDDLAWYQSWPNRIRGWRDAGKIIGRVRQLTEPLTDYLRFELFITPPAVEAGEDIRILSVDRVPPGLPRQDFWIFDDARVALMRFGPDGVAGADIITDPNEVQRYLTLQETAIRASLPYNDWASADAHR